MTRAHPLRSLRFDLMRSISVADVSRAIFPREIIGFEIPIQQSPRSGLILFSGGQIGVHAIQSVRGKLKGETFYTIPGIVAKE